jgi:rSAM/selenodomain-associated transferase 1
MLSTPSGRGIEVLGLMAKHWVPGEVKTRLGATVGNRISAGLHRQFVIHLCRRLASVGDHREVVVAPESAIPSIASCVSDRWHFRPQSDGDLGARMQAWFNQMFRNGGFQRAVLIGADCPNLKPDELRTSLKLLEQHQIVLGPATDGGYYLIGLQKPAGVPDDHLFIDFLFADMIWSREDVFEITRHRINRAGWSLGLLPPKSDIDRFADLQRLRKELQTNRELAPIDGELADEISRLLEDADAELSQ